MTQFRFAQGAAMAIVLGLAATAQPQDEGVKQVEQLVKKAREAVVAVADTKLQMTKTMDVYNGLMAEGAKDRKGAYKDLQKQMATTDERRAAIALRVGEMQAEADVVFKSWAESAAAIGDADLRKRSEDRLVATKASLAAIRASGQKAGELYGPVMKALQDQVTYLGHDLNDAAVASLKPNADKLNAQVQELFKRVDDTMTTAHAAIAAIGPR
jgi:hypothetical protein